MILKIFSQKNLAKKLACLTQNKAKFCKILIITLVFEKNAIFFAKNCQKSQKITSTPASLSRLLPRAIFKESPMYKSYKNVANVC
jgi:hypothetical protein